MVVEQAPEQADQVSHVRPAPLRAWAASLREAWALCRGRPPDQDAVRDASVGRLSVALLVLGLIEGAAWVACYGLSWTAFGELHRTRPMPAAVVWAVDTVALGGVAVLALGTVPDWLAASGRGGKPDRHRRALSGRSILCVSLLIGLSFVLLFSLPVGYRWYPSDWRRVFNFAFPLPIFRVLLLGPLWRRWGMVLAAGLGRMHLTAEPRLKALSASMSPKRVLATWVVPAFMTSIWCSRDESSLLGLVLSVAVLGLAYLAGVWLGRRGGGQSARSMLALGQITLLVFLIGYLICARALEHTW
jgi:hypothetical protein